jgi:hypothetical protein
MRVQPIASIEHVNNSEQWRSYGGSELTTVATVGWALDNRTRSDFVDVAYVGANDAASVRIACCVVPLALCKSVAVHGGAYAMHGVEQGEATRACVCVCVCACTQI